MAESAIERHGRALEEAFFARQNEELLERLRRNAQRVARRQTMAAASGVADEALLDRLMDLRLGPETLAALALAPLVLVAWADGGLDPREAAALRDAAHEAGLDPKSEAAALLDAWLAAPPPRELAAAWRDYARSLSAQMPQAARDALREQTIGRARRVAEAAGGFLGLGPRVSPAEAAVLASLESALAG